jgi:hypothetical protein
MREFAKYKEHIVECPLTHRFAPGVYLREIFMPAGSVIIGKRHKTKHFNIVLTGSATLCCEDGTRVELKAPATFVSEAGVQKVLIIHEDMRWQTVHATEARDMDALDAELVDPDEYPELDRSTERAAIAQAAQGLLT